MVHKGKNIEILKLIKKSQGLIVARIKYARNPSFEKVAFLEIVDNNIESIENILKDEDFWISCKVRDDALELLEREIKFCNNYISNVLEKFKIDRQNINFSEFQSRLMKVLSSEKIIITDVEEIVDIVDNTIRPVGQSGFKKALESLSVIYGSIKEALCCDPKMKALFGILKELVDITKSL